MKEISLKQFGDEYNFLNIEEDWAAAFADDGKEANALTIGWGSIGYLWSKPTITVYIHKERYSKHIFDNAEYFTVSIFKKPAYRKELQYLGSKSGRDEDKVKGCGLNVVKEENYSYFDQADYVIIAKKMGQTDFEMDKIDPNLGFMNYYRKTNGVHTIYEGEIIKILKKEA